MFKSIFIALLLSAAALAQTNITTCGTTITSSGTYNIPADIITTATTGQCILVNVTDGGSGVVINGSTHRLKNTSSSPATLLFVDDCTVPVTFHDIKFVYTASGLSSVYNMVYVYGSGGALGGYKAYSYNNLYSSPNDTGASQVHVDTSNNFTTYNDYFTNTALYLINSWYTSETYGTYDFSNSTTTVGSISDPLIINAGSRHKVQNNRFYTTQYTDDPIVIDSDDSNLTDVSRNTMSGAYYDAAIEFLGYVHNTTIENNTVTNSSDSAWTVVGGYHNSSRGVKLALDNVTISGNTLSSASSGGALVYFSAQDSPGYGYIKNTTVSGNTNNSGYDHSSFGLSGANFASASGNTITNNLFGVHGHIEFYPNTGYTDGGSNICGSTLPTNGVPIVCH